MRKVKMISKGRIRGAAHEFMASGLDRATVNLTDNYDLEPVDAWRRGGAFMKQYGLPIDVVIEGDRVVFVRKQR